ncbi:MAG TPA: hypothetical protein VLC06_00200 [Polyangia bacterium]|nr:hypothetical protein [Polyangia bacterium]
MTGRQVGRQLGNQIALALSLLTPLALGCQGMNTPIYFPSPDPILTVTGKNDAMGNPPRIENGMTLQFRNPTDAEQKTLDTQTAALGFDVPWIQRDHVHIELVYQVTYNAVASAAADDDPNDVPQFSLGIDGANEYTKYDENIVAMTLGEGNDDPPQYIPLIPVTPQTIAQGQTISGTVREDDFNEAELDLDAIGRWMAPFNAVLINNSQVNPIGLSMVPANVVIPALIEIDVNFTANRNMTCTYDIRVRDDNDQLLHDSADTLFSPTPTLFVPPAMMMTN